MEILLDRIEKENNPESTKVLGDLIGLSRKAGNLGYSMKEIASLCTMGYIVSQEPELQSLVDFLLTKVEPDNDFIN